MGNEFLQHTADIRLKVTGDTFGVLFTDSMKGLMKLMKSSFEPSGYDEVQNY